MCGISGIISISGEGVEPIEIETLNEFINHRGPDGEGIYISSDKKIAFAHKRLAIIDLSLTAKQPMPYLYKYNITFNGEIYNYKELKDELRTFGYEFQTNSDTEVLLACYDKWKEKMLDKLNGMWSFALHSTQNNEIFICRDRFGVKPLYYYNENGYLIFSSEVQAIHKFLKDKAVLNSNVIHDISKGSFDYHGGEETYIQNVKNLLGGHYIKINDGQFKIVKWYHLKKKDIPAKLKKQAVELKALVIDACKLRLRSDVPIGTCLSGGIDSGSITSIINNTKNTEVNFEKNNTHRSFCVSFPNSPIDESREAKDLAEIINSRLDIISLACPEIAELEEAMHSCDGPMHSLAFFPIWKLYKYIKSQGITVTLDGQGPDEMLGGYRPLPEALWAAIELRKPWWFYDLYRTYSAQGESSQFSSKKFARDVTIKLLKNNYRIVIKHFLRRFGLFKNTDILEKRRRGFSNLLDKNLFEQFFVSPLPGILNQYDRCSMAHGVECRMPFMDYRIVEFIFSLPPQSKVGSGYTKLVLRKAMKGILPDNIRLNKRKIGFNAPIVDWFKGGLREWMFCQMKSESFQNNPFFNGKEILASFEKFVINPKSDWNDAWKFWPPVHLAWWLDYIKTQDFYKK